MAAGLEIYSHSGPGYKPLVYSAGWMVALLNYEEIMSLENAHEIEQHGLTDEVFILLQGKAAFYLVSAGQPLEVVELEPGQVYNVLRGTWHNLLATREAVFAIVENRDTDLYDTHIRLLSPDEQQQLAAQLPGWVTGVQGTTR